MSALKNLNEVKYDFCMRLDNLDNSGGVAVRNELKSRYRLIPGEISKHKAMLDVSYNIDSMEYVGQSGKAIHWSFMEGKDFSGVLFNASTEENQAYLAGDEIKQAIKNQWESIDKLFSALPKLPAASIVHAFIYDVIGMDQTISHIISDAKIFESSGEMVRVESLSKVQCDMSVGLYGKDSNFTSGDVYAAYVGEGLYRGRLQRVFEFRCSEACFDCRHSTSQKQLKKQGYSYYDGIITSDVETGVVGYARMTETIFSNQSQEKKSSAGVLRRFVDMKAIF